MKDEAGQALWSAATTVCGLASTYPQLVTARMAVGFGEVGGVPPSCAIITDTYPPGRPGTAFGLYNSGPPVGAAPGVAFGGWIAVEFDWREAYATTRTLSLAGTLPFYLLSVWAPAWPLALPSVTMVLNYFRLSAAMALVQHEVRPDQRVLSGVLLLLTMNVIGLGLGPT